jgi:hypothetical protein
MGFFSDVWHAVSDPIAAAIEPIGAAIDDAVIQPVSGALADVDRAVFQPVTAPISQVGAALDDAVFQPITAPISDIGVSIDHAVNDVVPGGWTTLAQIAAAVATQGMSLGAQAGVSAGVGAAGNYAKNRDITKALQAGAISGATRYGIGTLGEYLKAPEISADADAQPGGFYGESGNVKVTPVPNTDINPRPYGPDVPIDSNTSGLQQVSNPSSGDEIRFFRDHPLNNTTMTDTGEYLHPITGEPINSPLNENMYQTPYVKPSGPVTMTDTGEIVDPVTFQKVPNEMLYQPPTNGELLDTAAKVKQGGLGQEGLASDTSFNQQYLDEMKKAGANYNAPLQGANIVDKSTPYSGDPIKYESTFSKLGQMPGALLDTGINYAKTLSPTDYALGAAGIYGLSRGMGGGGGDQPAPSAEDAAKAQSYGTANSLFSPYELRNRLNAGNVYDSGRGFRSRYADGGEVQHFGLGGDVSDYLTKFTQPIEKAIVRPIGDNVPFVKDLAPYAGVIAGAAMGNPAMAAGIGGLASGFGKPGGFDMKRAFMGGVAAYGLSNIAGGIEAAGQAPNDLTGGFYGDPDVINQVPNQTFRDPTTMQKGISNLLENSNTPAYKDAMTAFKGTAGLYSAGVPTVMGLTGMAGVDESNALKAEYDKSVAANESDAAKFNARVAESKRLAQKAVSEHPYKFDMGGQINSPDDQTGMPNQTPLQHLERGGILGYAEGGVPRFLSGGGDGMSDSIKANIDGTQEARLADGEFVIPADVVSHLGNGSSKAGAKQLYAMMDRVRQARTGNSKQGREIIPTKFMPV